MYQIYKSEEYQGVLVETLVFLSDDFDEVLDYCKKRYGDNIKIVDTSYLA